MKTPSLRDSCCLVDLIDGCVQESASKPSLTDELEECLLGSTKIDKENTEAKVYEEVLDKSHTSTNQRFKTLVIQSN